MNTLEYDVGLFKCRSTETVVDAMKKIDENTYGLVYVVDESDKLIGCITDGDIRRWIMKGGKVRAPLEKAMNNAPIYVFFESRSEGFGIMAEKGIASVAVVDDDYHITEVLLSAKRRPPTERNKELSETPVIVMAGGKGTRLYPYTKILPKPLIPIGDVPILERILNRFAYYGVMEFYLTINYRKEMIKSYFAESSFPYRIKYVEEPEPLGTAGSIRLINDVFKGPIIITNCDILIEADYVDILRHHVESGNDLTIVSSLKNTVIPYGVIHSKENGLISDMVEKPELSNFINTGMYIMNPDFVDWIPEERVFHMTQLAELMIQNGKQVGMYPISENSFLDMGEFAEMKKMEERINSGFITE